MENQEETEKQILEIVREQLRCQNKAPALTGVVFESNSRLTLNKQRRENSKMIKKLVLPFIKHGNRPFRKIFV